MFWTVTLSAETIEADHWPLLPSMPACFNALGMPTTPTSFNALVTLPSAKVTVLSVLARVFTDFFVSSWPMISSSLEMTLRLTFVTAAMTAVSIFAARSSATAASPFFSWFSKCATRSVAQPSSCAARRSRSSLHLYFAASSAHVGLSSDSMKSRRTETQSKVLRVKFGFAIAPT